MLSTTTISGRVAAEPELRTTRDGKAVASIRVAVDDHHDRRHEVRWIEVAQFGDAAERLARYVDKGQLVICEGLLDADAYLTSTGEPALGWKLRNARIDYGPRARTSQDDTA